MGNTAPNTKKWGLKLRAPRGSMHPCISCVPKNPWNPARAILEPTKTSPASINMGASEEASTHGQSVRFSRRACRQVYQCVLKRTAVLVLTATFVSKTNGRRDNVCRWKRRFIGYP